jgi:PhnB protein
MTSINPYLNFNGNTKEAFDFYKSVFNQEYDLKRFSDMEGSENLPAKDRDKVMHVTMPIGNNALMASDALESAGQSVLAGNNFHISVDASSEEEATRIYNGLAAGGVATMPLAKTFWGAYFGMLTDQFGIHWMVSFNEARPSE